MVNATIPRAQVVRPDEEDWPRIARTTRIDPRRPRDPRQIMSSDAGDARRRALSHALHPSRLGDLLLGELLAEDLVHRLAAHLPQLQVDHGISDRLDRSRHKLEPRV